MRGRRPGRLTANPYPAVRELCLAAGIVAAFAGGLELVGEAAAYCAARLTHPDDLDNLLDLDLDLDVSPEHAVPDPDAADLPPEPPEPNVQDRP